MSTETSAGMRLLFFIVKKLTVLVLLIMVIMIAFFIAYDMANVYVFLDDGMTQRANVILNNEDPTVLNRFFTLKCLNSDPMLNSNPFRDYIIQDYDYKLKVTKLWVWPWQSSTVVEVIEYIKEDSWMFTITDDFRARLIAAQAPDGLEEGEEFQLKIPKPQWQNGKKEIHFRKIDGQWKIDGIVFIESLKPEDMK